MRLFIYVFMRHANQEHPDICPNSASIIYYITTSYFAKKRSDHKYWQKQKHQYQKQHKGIYTVDYSYYSYQIFQNIGLLPQNKLIDS